MGDVLSLPRRGRVGSEPLASCRGGVTRPHPPACFIHPASGASSSLSASSALWSLLRADGASGSSHRRVQCHGGANERLQRLFINLVALMEIDGTPGVAFEAGVEEA